MNRERSFWAELFSRYWFFLGIALAVSAAILVPSATVWLRHWKVLKIGIFSVFLITGLTLELGHIQGARQNATAVVGSLISSLVLFPALTFILGRLVLTHWPDFQVGSLIIAVAPVTIASGAVMTGIAGGNIALSLFICIAGNIAAIFTAPFSLDILLHGKNAVDLPAARMIVDLFFIIIVPIAIGQLMRRWLQDALKSCHKGFSIFSQLVVLMIIFNAVASSAARLGEAGARIGLLFLFVIFLHGMIVALNFGVSRLIHLDPPSTAAFTIQTSQKTLTVSYIVWSGYFATAFPMAILPAICYHLTQMVADTFLAHWMRNWMRNQN
jgi:solute carrier family 10 (sodium/bile acid cotransporter), member 7